MKPTDALPHPDDWRGSRVRDAIELKRGLSWSKEQEQNAAYDGAVPVIGIGNVQDQLDLRKLIYLTGVGPQEVSEKRASKGWIVLVGSNGNRRRIGNAVYISEDKEFLFASFLLAAKPYNSSGVLPKYFFRWLSTDQVQAHLSASAEGSTGLSNLSHSFFRSMWLAFPIEDEQAAIARVLDAVDAGIDNARESVRSAKSLDDSLLHELLAFGLSGTRSARSRPVHWDIKSVSEVAEVGSGVTLGKDVTGFKYEERPYLRVANVQDGHLNLETIKTVKVKATDVSAYELEPGDVLMTEGGDLDKLGRGALWEGQIPGCLHQNHIFRVRCDGSQVLPKFFGYIVESDIAKRYFLRVAKRTTNLASTNKTQVRAFRFPVPPLSEQQKIFEIMDASKAMIRAFEQKEAALQELKKSLMQDLLSGTKRIDPALFPQLLKE